MYLPCINPDNSYNQQISNYVNCEREFDYIKYILIIYAFVNFYAAAHMQVK